MAPKIQPIELFLKLRGLNDLKSFTKGFADFKSTVKLTAPQVTRLLKELTKVHGNTKLSTKAIQGQITALKELRNNVGKDTKAYERLSAAILRFSQANKKAADVAIQKRIYAQRKGNLGRIAALESGTGSFKGFSQRASEITARANLAASGRAFLGSADAQLRPISGLAQQIQQIGLAQVDAQFQRLGQSVSQVRGDILAAAKAGGNNVNALNAQRAALETLRNGVEIGSQKFKQLTRDIQGVERRLNSLTKFSGKSLLGAGQGLLGATFVGGGAGLAGGLAGMGIEALRTGGNLQQGAITGGLIGSQLISPVAGFISQSAQYTAALDKAKIALRGLIGNQEDFEIALNAANKATEEFNVPQEVAIKGMQRLSAAVIGAGGNVHNAEEAFLNTVAAIKATGGTADDVKSAITAMVQIFSKGRVSAEELSGQLGERFPAAVTQFARANNMSTETLQANLKAGTVGLDMLSKFIASLGDEYVPLAKEIAKSNEEAGARLVIATNRMRIAIGKNFKDIGAEFQIIQAELMTELAPTIGEFAKIAVSGLSILVDTIKIVVGSFDELGVALKAVTAAFITLKITSIIASFKSLSAVMLRVAAALGKLTAMLTAATAAQKRFNLAVLKNKYVILAASIVAAIKLIDEYKARQKGILDDAKKGFSDLSTKSKVELKLDLKSSEENIKRLRKRFDNILGGEYQMDDDGKTVFKSKAALRKEILDEIQVEQGKVSSIKTTLGILGDKNVFDPAVGANTKTKDLLNLEADLIQAMKDKNKELQLETKLRVDLKKLNIQFEKKKKGTGDDKKLSEADQQDFDNKKAGLLFKFRSDTLTLLEKEKSITASIKHELGLITDEKKQDIDLNLRATQIARDHKDILKLHGLVTEDNKVKMEELIELLKEANKEAIDGTKFGEAGVLKSFKDELENVGTAMENIVVNGFTKMEDALTNFVMTGKLNFRDFANSIISDLTRMFIRAAITKPLFDLLPFGSGGVVGNDVQGFGGQQIMTAAKGRVIAKNKIVPYAKGGLLSQYANKGIVSRPTLFPMADGIGLMGEAGAEAVMPLKRTRQGRLGVEASGGTGNVVNVTVNAGGTSAQGNTMKANQLGKMIGTAIEAELIKQKRPGGILYT